MTDIYEGIYTLWNNDATLKAALPYFYNTKAPARVSYPYCVFILITSRPDYTFNRSYERAVFQFSIYDDIESGISNINSIHDKMCDTYDDGIITTDTGIRYKMARRRESILEDQETEAYQLTMDYEIMKTV